VTLTTQLSHEQLIDWGWRVPYVFGLLVGPAGLYIRSHIDETPDFLKAERSQKVSGSDLLRRHPRSSVAKLLPDGDGAAQHRCADGHWAARRRLP
jgi:hypothetical protein